jgi:hypothetical protein
MKRAVSSGVGALDVADGAVHWRVWAPHATCVELVHSQIHFVAYDFCRGSQMGGFFWLSRGTEEIILTKH